LPEEEKEISLTELAAGNGGQGKPTLIAHGGLVIDVSASELWAGGEHMGLHRAGQDLTREFADAPHGVEVLERYPQVGVLPAVRESGAEGVVGAGPRIPAFLARLLVKVPLLKRHPHPMVVHFPIVFMLAATFFTVLYVLTGEASFEVTAWHCLGGGVFFTPVAMATGVFSWWLNYEARFLRQITMKLILSPILLALGTAALVWRWVEPGVLDSLAGVSLIYFALVLMLTPLVLAIGWFGATLTFPLHED
jgi:predicted heme/steroid binding protein/uncharacterized membrane protein